jgi:hypothetical protein
LHSAAYDRLHANGVVSLLRSALEPNNAVTDEDWRHRLTNFNDREWKVGDALQVLDFYALQHDLRLSLATVRMLDMIRWGKISLRRSIQSEVNYYGRRGVKPNLAKIRSLIEAIEKLNAEIIEIEKLVNSRALDR